MTSCYTTIIISAIPAGSAGIQWPGMGSTQYLYPQHLPSMDSGSRHSLPRWQAATQIPQYPSFQQGTLESSDQGWEVYNIDIPSTYLPWILDLGIPYQDDEHQNKNQKPPSFQQGALESSAQGWEVHNIDIPSTHPPWILDLGNPCQDDEQLHNHHNTRHSSRDCWNPVTRDGKYTISTFPALTFHGFWISAIPAKMTSIRTKTKNHRHSSRERWNLVSRDGKYTISIFPAPTLHGF